MSTTIIIGASAAGLAAAGKLRDLCPEETIICLSKEQEMPYNRCLLADLVSGTRTQEQIHTKPKAFFIEHTITLRLDATVTALDVGLKKLMLASGETLAYDSLVIATGKSPFMPPPLDQKDPAIFPFYDLRDVCAINALIEEKKPKTAIVVGGGITGLEACDSLLTRNLSITLVERSSQLLPRQIDPNGATFVQKLLEKKGIPSHVNTTVNTVERSEKGLTATLSNGMTLLVDMIVAAAGARRNDAFLAGTGIVIDDHGVVVNERQETSIPHIFAAGDICSVHDLLTGGRMNSSIWPDAVAQGITAAYAIAGRERTYPGALNMTSSHIFGITLATCGDLFHKNDHDVLHKKADDFYHRLYVKDNILQGFVMVGNVGNVGQLRKAILEKKPF